METVAPGPTGPVSGPSAAVPRDLVEWTVLAVGLALAAAAWMLATAHGPGHAGGLPYGSRALVWWAMMTAMMLPSALPWSLAWIRLSATGPATPGRRGARGGWPSVGRFAWTHRSRSAAGGGAALAAGILAVWGLVGAVAAALQEPLSAAVSAATTADVVSARVWVAAALAIAGAYQLSPAKHACLRRCRSPVGTILAGRSDRRGDALRVGVGHGVVCVGCCWALMGAHLAIGAASVLWMVAVTILVTVEKVAPGGPAVARLSGWILLVAAAAVLAGGRG